MRLTTRYIGAGVVVFILILTYEMFLYSGNVKRIFMNRKLSKDDYIIKAKYTYVQKVNLTQLTSSTFRLNTNILKSPDVSITAEEFRRNSKIKTGNVLIDNYGKNDQMKNGENGRGVTFVGAERRNVSEVLQKYQVNTIASDIIPLNRLVPDSRPPG
jgi:hypothetical protein